MEKNYTKTDLLMAYIIGASELVADLLQSDGTEDELILIKAIRKTHDKEWVEGLLMKLSYDPSEALAEDDFEKAFDQEPLTDVLAPNSQLQFEVVRQGDITVFTCALAEVSKKVLCVTVSTDRLNVDVSPLVDPKNTGVTLWDPMNKQVHTNITFPSLSKYKVVDTSIGSEGDVTVIL